MNNQLIEKIIKSNNEICPEFSFDNPLLDRNVARALSKSFVKILNISKQDSKINNNLRLSILENIRKMCEIEPGDHVRIDENVMELLTDYHSTNCKHKSIFNNTDSVNKTLDAFLLQRIEDCELDSKYKSELNPEIIQSLLNLQQNEIFNVLPEDVIHWDITDCKYIRIIDELFNKNGDCLKKTKILNDIAIKMIPNIEKLFLEHCILLLKDKEYNIDSLLAHNSFQQLVKTCAVSSKCFQICCAIMNFIFIVTNFNSSVQEFVSKFISLVKSHCSQNTFYPLYPTHISHIALLLDFNKEELPLSMQDIYIQSTLRYLAILCNEQESDLIMLLSHYSTWFAIYFESKYCSSPVF